MAQKQTNKARKAGAVIAELLGESGRVQRGKVGGAYAEKSDSGNELTGLARPRIVRPQVRKHPGPRHGRNMKGDYGHV